jgi:hypothetical protein
MKSAGGLDKNYYSDCMDILNIDMDELREFVEPGSGPSQSQASMDAVDRLFEEQNIDTTEAVEMFTRLLDERVELERSTGQVSQKYEDYIKRMKDDIVSERRTYEDKIRKLEKSLKKQGLVSG